MKRSAVWLAVFVAATAVPAALAGSEADVRAAEIAFAKTMADRDVAAFASFLAPDAIFVSEDGTVLRGPEEIVAAWKVLFDGELAPFSWEPEHVAVTPSGDLAVSTGPVRDPAGAHVGRFTSTWRRAGDGSWQIVLDAGCSYPRP